MRPGRRLPEHAYSCNTHARSAEGPDAGGPHGRSRSGDTSSTASFGRARPPATGSVGDLGVGEDPGRSDTHQQLASHRVAPSELLCAVDTHIAAADPGG